MSVKVLAKDKIVQAYNLINHLEPLSVCNVFGVQKLKRKIEAETKFLNKSLLSNDVKEEHIHCSNIGQLASLVEVATSIPGVTAVLKSFDIGNGEKLIIDVVGENNCKWYKVILRNPKALHQLHIFGGRNGVRPLDKIAQDILSAAKANPAFFVPPKVCFVFVNGVSERLANSLKLLGVEVKGQIKTAEELGLPVYEAPESSSEDEDDYQPPRRVETPPPERKVPKSSKNKGKFATNTDVSEKLPSPTKVSSLSSSDVKKVNDVSELYSKVNLDVTCLIAFVSATSNGGCNFVFEDVFLNEQAESERKKPVKKVLNGYFKGKELLVCEEAASHFRTILETIGGKAEMERGEKLLQKCSIIPSQHSFKWSLRKGGRIKELSLLIFGTGQALKAPTITSNRGFVRAAENQGVKLAVLYHEPRALTERKETAS